MGSAEIDKVKITVFKAGVLTKHFSYEILLLMSEFQKIMRVKTLNSKHGIIRQIDKLSTNNMGKIL